MSVASTDGAAKLVTIRKSRPRARHGEWTRNAPVDWGRFGLAYHGWTAPIERAVAAAEVAKVSVLTPRPEESVELADARPMVRGWPLVPSTRGDQDPIAATRMGDGTR